MAKVLIIGAGGAGLAAAIAAKEAGGDVTVVTKEYPTRSQTCMAQGGINAALRSDDSVEQHIADTLKSAKGLASEKAVTLLCQSAPKTIEWLNSIGVPFSRTQEGTIAQRKLGGAYAARACYTQDYTGLKILHTLYDYANKLGITFLNERYLLELVVENGVVKGAVVLNIKTGELETHTADSVVLAGGGYSKLYAHYSTNSKAASGDIIAAAKKVGCKLRNMEFVQFHPTALKNSSILISESARGVGGKLLNSKGERFVDELKPRDEVSQAIYNEIKKGEEIFLDITHIGEKFIDEELPQERKLALLYEGVDPVYEKLPIKPAAHYTMGGIAVGIDMQTNIENLYAVGECSEAQIHGANRLGGNSLLEIVAFGRIAGENAATKRSTPATNATLFERSAKETIEQVFSFACDIDFYEEKKKLGKLFYEKCGIKRNAKELEELIEKIEALQQNIPKMGLKDKSKIYNTNLIDLLEFHHTLLVAKEVACAALANTQSVGAHVRSDV